MKSKLLTIFLIFISVNFAFSQETTNDSLRISGVIFSQDGLSKIQGVHIRLGNKGMISDPQGHFSLWAHPYDTLEFSHIGFQPMKVTIADSLSTGEYGFGIFLAADTVRLGEVIVFPRKLGSPEFEVKNMRTDKEVAYAKQNLQMATFTAVKRPDISGWDAEKNQQHQQQRMKMQAMTMGSLPYEHMVNITALIPLSFGLAAEIKNMDMPQEEIKLTKYEEDVIIDFYKKKKR